MRVYLDACCFSRLTDDQSQPRVREEAEAIEHVLEKVRLGVLELISSEALKDEVRKIRSLERRSKVETLLSMSSMTVEVDSVVSQRGWELGKKGYGFHDALHIATAEAASADVLLSTDDRLIKRAARGLGNPGIPVRNPVSWKKEQGT